MCLKIKKSGKIELKYKELGMFLKFPVSSCLDERFFLIRIKNRPPYIGTKVVIPKSKKQGNKYMQYSV